MSTLIRTVFLPGLTWHLKKLINSNSNINHKYSLLLLESSHITIIIPHLFLESNALIFAELRPSISLAATVGWNCAYLSKACRSASSNLNPSCTLRLLRIFHPSRPSWLVARTLSRRFLVPRSSSFHVRPRIGTSQIHPGTNQRPTTLETTVTEAPFSCFPSPGSQSRGCYHAIPHHLREEPKD